MAGTATPDGHTPVPCTGPAVWRGPELTPDEWTVRLGERQVGELAAALRTARGRGGTLLRTTAADFPLPTLAADLARISTTLATGTGFALVRGIPVERLTEADASGVLWGIGQHLGRPVSQNADGHMLGHVRDTGRSLADPSTRGYQTREAVPFHNDASDVLALLCLRTARSGGRTSLVSSAAVHNAVLERRPDLAARLYRTHCTDRRDEHGPGEPPCTRAPIAVRLPGGGLSMRYNRCYLESAQRFPEVPRLEPADTELHDLVDALAASPGLRLDLDAEPGDLLLLNNHTVMHARSAFQDFHEPDRARHLLRLWLDTGYGTTTEAARRGITPRDVIRPRNQVPEPRHAVAVPRRPASPTDRHAH
ncbi:TauD/TfdA family dioxygenase [Streptomyces fructofermentans]|uniref:TauD/TfdA-like domain-containing protein n=1 Tax=Streptomyces fructofermentans TaxID=152141 RepID=A0A918KGM1_9ACTN|nr:TauD/TfdA family dioxygenase [Streptomyces fructofermentans]GGX62819.1 hypothetical protein GCM10010515_33100 [Streptomyces fructofermentans]